MAFKSLSEIKRLVEQAEVTKHEKRDDGLQIWTVDLTKTQNRSIDIEAKSAAEAREKVINYLAETEMEKPKESK